MSVTEIGENYTIPGDSNNESVPQENDHSFDKEFYQRSIGILTMVNWLAPDE